MPNIPRGERGEQSAPLVRASTSAHNREQRRGLHLGDGPGYTPQHGKPTEQVGGVYNANGPRQSREPSTWQGVAFRPPVASPPEGPRRTGAAKVAAVSVSQKRERRYLVSAAVNEAERERAKANARAAGLSVSGYMRSLLSGEVTPHTRRAKPPPEIKALAILLGQLGKAGSNLNQLARLGNRGQPIPLPELMETLAAVRAAAEKVRQALK